MLYTAEKFQFPVYTTTNKINDNVKATVAIAQVFTTLTPQILYNIYNTQKFKFYLDAGVGFRLAMYPDNKITIAGNTQKNIYNLDSFYAVFPFQAGVVFNKKVELSASYIANTDASHSNLYNISNKYFSVGVKYLF